MAPEDRVFFDRMVANLGGAVCGRGMFEAAGRWGGTNPFGGPLFVLTHRTEQEPPTPDSGFVFVSSFDEALRGARAAAGDKDVSISGGADVIRQGLEAGEVDELVVSTHPLGKSHWLERGVVEKARERFALPVTHVVVDRP